LPSARPLRKYGRWGRPDLESEEKERAQSTQRDAPPAPGVEAPQPSRRSLYGLDWFVFFLADAQMGFGPLVAV